MKNGSKNFMVLFLKSNTHFNEVKTLFVLLIQIPNHSRNLKWQITAYT